MNAFRDSRVDELIISWVALKSVVRMKLSSKFDMSTNFRILFTLELHGKMRTDGFFVTEETIDVYLIAIL